MLFQSLHVKVGKLTTTNHPTPTTTHILAHARTHAHADSHAHTHTHAHKHTRLQASMLKHVFKAFVTFSVEYCGGLEPAGSYAYAVTGAALGPRMPAVGAVFTTVYFDTHTHTHTHARIIVKQQDKRTEIGT